VEKTLLSLVVVMVAMGSESIIYFPFSFPLLGFDLESEHAYDLEDLTRPLVTAWLDTHSCYEWALIELTPFSSVLLCLHGIVHFLWLLWVVLGCATLALSFFMWFLVAFPLLQIKKSKISLLRFKFMLDLNSVPIGGAQQGYVHEIHLILDVPMYTTVVVEYQMALIILDTQLCAKSMKNIC